MSERRENSANVKSDTLLIGVGSPHGDDRVGWEVVDALADSPLTARKAKTPAEVLDYLDSPLDRLILCDGCRGIGAPGQSVRWQWPIEDVLNVHWSGTHNLSLPTVLRLADRLDRLPNKVVVWGVEIGSAEPGRDISAAVLDAAPRLAQAILDETLGTSDTTPTTQR